MVYITKCSNNLSLIKTMRYINYTSGYVILRILSLILKEIKLTMVDILIYKECFAAATRLKNQL